MVAARTPARRGPTFVCARRRGLCSMSGRYPYGDRQPSNAPPLLLSPAGLASRRGPHTKTRLGLCPKTPLTLSCGWIRTMRSIVRTAPQIRSQGACGAFYFGPSRDQIKNQPYKRRRVGRNLRLSRADPALCSGQPSSLRCILLSPQGLATLRGPPSQPFRAGVPVRRGLGVYPKSLLGTFGESKVPPRR